ncbi:hypothetical protein PTSG_00604 [Salpingoeca rosetta]|uniref:C3H1-type domain-containing protein n=1 Tax=Salpingoeca rosetta (strain ATCC 50818 / BSB-021) TaxID=946362 RepID=F2TWY5_SALR5|nr:uncharacterized protein PTSG_00604 [Salpingoeca rosetta]EGD75894.1 hypothetical protein PTSG_00604 [Salpingoeca rosetta]|eukprot:XP_004998070.1 hypothetical protein PTSG_00604 [Salpingoeca rosetta]
MAMEARYAGVCKLCAGDVKPGDRIWPGELEPVYVQGIGKKPRGVRMRRPWVHVQCAAAQAGVPESELVPPLCKHWKQRGTCLGRERCIFSHPEELGAAVRERLVSERARREARAKPNRHGEVEAPIQNRGKGKRNLVRNKARSSVFRRFIIDTFGWHTLMSGSGVLDVAAGKGEVSFELTRLCGIPAVSVEPRAMSLERFVRRMRKGAYHQNPLFLNYTKFKTPTASMQHTECRILHVRSLFQMPLEEQAEEEEQEEEQEDSGLPLCLRDETAWQESVAAARILTWDRSGLHEKGAVVGRKHKAPRSETKRARRRRGRKLGRIWKEALASGMTPEEAIAELRRVQQQEEEEERKRKQQQQQQVLGEKGEKDEDEEEDDDGVPFMDVFDMDEGSGGEDTTTVQRDGHEEGEHRGGQDGADNKESGKEDASDADNSDADNSNDEASDGDESDDGDDDGGGGGDDDDGDDDDDAGNSAAENEGVADDKDGDNSHPSPHNATDGHMHDDAEESAFIAELRDYEEARQAVLSASVVVGLHPDQAAEHLVKFALRHRKPFAVVPCCVYAREFPTRRLPNGKRVHTHLQLVEYLQSLAPGIVRVELPFEGKNVCLYKASYD